MEKNPVVETLSLPPCEVFLVSDLHIARGEGNDLLYTGTENFFYDDAFARWLEYCKVQCNGKKGVLIINGDFVDFLRVIFDEGEWENLDFNSWSDELGKVDIAMTPEELKATLDESAEKDYGFKTNDFKSIWKLQKVMEGHQVLFDALANWFLNNEHELIIFKGNHDLEWLWEKVQKYLIVILEQRLKKNNITIDGRVRFYQDAVIINDTLYIEHGNRYDTFTFVDGDDEFMGEHGKELNLPLGSFVNRYIANGVESEYPFMDNIRPSENLVPMLLNKDFGLALKIIFKRIPYMFKILKKKQIMYVFGRFFDFALIVLIPVLAAALVFYIEWKRLPAFQATVDGMTKYLSLLKSVLPLIGSYFMGRIVSHFRLSEPDNLYGFCRPVFTRFPKVKIITMGHTHIPFQKCQGGKKYINSGTWIPQVEYSSTALRDDNTYNFIHFTVTRESIISSPLLRWNDSANRPDKMAIMDDLPLN